VTRELARVRRAADKAALARQQLDDAMRQAQASGASLRAIAKEASLSPEWVRRRIRGD
jgi:DNA-binding Lrp family transcriptional regulator